MAYARSLDEIPLDEEPHLSVLESLMPALGDDGVVDWDSATADEIRHVQMCPRCAELLGGFAPGPKSVAATSSDVRQNLLKYHNQARQNAGKPKLALHSTLNALADEYANTLASKNWWNGHTRPNGWCFDQWWNANAPKKWAQCSPPCQGSSTRCNAYVGENLGRGYSNTPGIFDAWMASTLHKRNIMNRDFRLVGFGTAVAKNGTRYWVAHFVGE